MVLARNNPSKVVAVKCNNYWRYLRSADERVHEKLHENRPALVNRKNVILRYGAACPHTTRVTQEKILDHS